MLKNLKIDEYCTDNWKYFKNENHKIDKEIEGVNTSLSTRNKRLVRKTTYFSKKDENYQFVILLMFVYRNKEKNKT